MMRRVIITVCVCSLCLGGVLRPVSAGDTLRYAELLGKWVEVHGPFCWDVLGIALTEESYPWFQEALSWQNKKAFQKVIMNSEDMLYIRKDEKAIVLDMDVIQGKAQVTILTGVHTGISGWIPIEWLQGNQKRPTFQDYL